MAVKVLRVFQEFTSAGYVPMPIAGNIDYGVTVANTFPATTPATFQTDDPDIEVNVTEVTDFYVWIRSHGTAWNYLYTRNVRVYPDSPSINNVVMGIIIARLTDAVPYTGATQDTDLGEFGLKAGWLGLDLTPTNTPTDVGTISWDDQDGTANLVLKGGNVNLQIGQEQVTRVVNKTGASLLEANYQAVRISGAQGNRLKVSLAQANNDANSADTIGLVTETIANNEEGFVTTSGLVKGINTTGSLQSETWVDGDVLYLSGTTAGMITNVKPQAPTHTVIIGYVVRAHATQGQIYVKVDNGYELDELHNVRITTPTDKDFLIYDGTNQYWKNRDLFGTTGYLPVYDTTSLLKDSIIYTDGTAIGIGTNVLQSGAVATFGDVAHFTENISLADSKGIVSGGVNMLSRNNLNNQIIIGADGGINDNVAFYSGDLERMRLLANGRLAINKTTASYQVDVQGDVNVSGAFRVNGTIIPNGTVTSVAMSVPTGLVISGSPITSSGTLAVTYAVNYGIPTLTKQSDWDDAYTWVTNFPDQLGNAGKFLTTNGSVLSWASLVTGVSSVFGRTGAVVAQSGDYTTAQVTESGNLYYTDARARLALSGGTGITYNNTTGVIAYSGTVYTDSSIRGLFSAGAGISYNNTTGVITSTITQYTDAMARASLSFVAGSGAYNSTTGVITIPTNTNQLTNGASFITLASLSASAPLSYNNGTGAFSISQASGSTNGFLSSTDWNTFNNKQNSLTNPVTGTGTANYYSRFSGTTSIGNGLISDDATNVSISGGVTSSSFYRVNKNGSDSLGGGAFFALYNTAFTSAMFMQLNASNGLDWWNSGVSKLMTLTSSGNLGLGVTPSAWSGNTSNVLEFSNGVALLGNKAVPASYLVTNAYSSNGGASFIYKNTDFATSYIQYNGQHLWSTAPSGTAGTAISFTQAMTLDASGKLLIGTTTADANSLVNINGAIKSSQDFRSIVNGSDSAYQGGFYQQTASGTTYATAFQMDASGNQRLWTYNVSSGFVTRLLINNSTGNVSIGNTNNTYKLDVNNVGAGVANTRIYGNDQANVRLRLENAGAGGRTYEIVGGLAGANNSSFSIFDATASSTRLQIDSSGAATFSSSVTASGIINGTTSQFTAGGTAINTIYASGPSTFGVSSSDAIYLRRYGVGEYQFQTVSGGASGGNLSLQSYGGNVAIGTTSPNSRLQVNGNGWFDGFVTTYGDSNNIRLYASTGSNGAKNKVQWVIEDGSEMNYIQSIRTNEFGFGDLIFATRGGSVAERMRITSTGNVAIGTSSPTQLLTVNGEISAVTRFRVNPSTQTNQIIGDGNAFSIGGSNNLGIRNDSGSIVFASGGSTVQLQLNTSGNLGLGVTPSAWSVAVGFDIARNGGFFGDGNNYDFSTGIIQNGYRSGNTTWAYKLPVGAARFELNNNSFAWYNAPSGTAGNTISFTQVMTLDSSGRLGIGTTSPQWLLELYKDTSSGSFGQYPAISVNNPNASGYSAYYFFQGSTNKGGIEYSNSTNALSIFGNGAERMRITSQGRLLLGTTSSGSLMFEFSDGANTNKYTTLAGNLRAVGRITDDLTNVRGIGFGYSSAENLGFIYGTSNGTNTSKLAFLIFNGSTWQTNMTLKTGGTTLNIGGIPSSNAGLVSGDVYKDANGFLKIV